MEMTLASVAVAGVTIIHFCCPDSRRLTSKRPIAVVAQTFCRPIVCRPLSHAPWSVDASVTRSLMLQRKISSNRCWKILQIAIMLSDVICTQKISTKLEINL